MLFTKPTYEELMLPFRHIEISDDLKLRQINIEAYGNVFGKNKYCYAWYELKTRNNNDFNDVIELLKNSAGKKVKVIIKLKKGIAKDFKLDIDSLSEAYNDERFKLLSLLGWGFNDKSYEELTAKR